LTLLEPSTLEPWNPKDGRYEDADGDHRTGRAGVLFLTKILTECALELGEEVIASEIHGMAMRGGSSFLR